MDVPHSGAVAETLSLMNVEPRLRKSQGSRALSGATIQSQAPLPFCSQSSASPCMIWGHCFESCFWTELCPYLLPNSRVQAELRCDYIRSKEVTKVT